MASENKDGIASGSQKTFHCINKPDEAINETLLGLVQCHPYLSYMPKHKIVCRNDLETFRNDHVTTIACCGGGHEPMFSGFVGPSFLSAAVSGNVFASPTGRQMFEAIKLCQPSPPHKSHGTLLLVGNYTGDILNAGLAITRAQAAGYSVRFVAIGDDVAVGRKKGGKVGRRGLSGHIIALKLACALAEQGAGLDEVVAAAENVAANVGTIAVAFDRVALPTALITDLPTLPADTIELGMGAHGEPGLERISPIPTLPVLIKRMVSLLADTSDADRAFIPLHRGARVGLLVNSLGSTSERTLWSFAEQALRELKEEWGLEVVRLKLGPFVTSLKMSGVGLTLWRVDEGDAGRKQLELWDWKVKCVAWRP